MNNISNQPAKNFYRAIVIKGCLIFISIVLIGLFWFLRDIRVNKILKNKENEISESILNTIQNRANLHLLLPQLVIINADTLGVSKLSDSILRRVAKHFVSFYFQNNSARNKEKTIQPYFVFPEKEKSNDSYKLTQEQLEDLKNHLSYLVSEVDKAIEATKNEIDRQINQLNTWVTIWIGILAIFGTIIPLFYNIKSSESIKELKDNADIAKTKADKAVEKLTLHEPNLNKLGSLEGKIGSIEKSISSTKDKSEIAIKNSKEANTNSTQALNRATQTEQIVTTLNMINKLNMFDPSNLIQIDNPEEAFNISVRNIYSHLNDCQAIYNHPIIIDSLRQLATHLHLISFYGFISRARIAELNTFSISVNETLLNNYNQDSFVQLMNQLNHL